jgi:hypothetical protein
VTRYKTDVKNVVRVFYITARLVKTNESCSHLPVPSWSLQGDGGFFDRSLNRDQPWSMLITVDHPSIIPTSSLRTQRTWQNKRHLASRSLHAPCTHVREVSSCPKQDRFNAGWVRAR